MCDKGFVKAMNASTEKPKSVPFVDQVAWMEPVTTDENAEAK